MITVIVPHARPCFSSNIIANFERQKYSDARLLVVENGEAIGSFCYGNSIVLKSDNHQASAMNTALAWLRSNGDGNWARFDDDDYYGENYLSIVKYSLNSEVNVISGFPWRYVMLDDGLHLFQGNDEFTGGTLAASTAYVPEFKKVSDDDLQWCIDTKRNGMMSVSRDYHGYCYDRRTRDAKRVIQGGTKITRFAFGRSLFYGKINISSVDDHNLKPICEFDSIDSEEVVDEYYSMQGSFSI